MFHSILEVTTLKESTSIASNRWGMQKLVKPRKYLGKRRNNLGLMKSKERGEESPRDFKYLMEKLGDRPRSLLIHLHIECICFGDRMKGYEATIYSLGIEGLICLGRVPDMSGSHICSPIGQTCLANPGLEKFQKTIDSRICLERVRHVWYLQVKTDLENSLEIPKLDICRIGQ
jgi:hypothetical protein